MKFTHDVIVIGAGAAGLTSAGGCALFGLKVALIEAHKMGGECLNNGCVPSKALISAARRAAEANVSERFGVTIGPPQVDWSGVHQFVHQTIADIEPHDSQERFEGLGCEVIRSYARVTGKQSVEVDGRELTAPRIIIATGSKPFVPPIEGLEQVSYLTNENLFELSELPSHLVIIGGGVIGMEMGQSFCRLGSKVTIVNSGQLMSRDDPDSVEVLVEKMRGEGVNFVQGKVTKVGGVTDGGISIETDGGDRLRGSHLLIAAGRKANCTGFGLEDLGVAMGSDGIDVDSRRRTSVKSIYAVGDCREGPRLTHVCGYEGGNVVRELVMGIPSKVNWSKLPWCVYTDPEVAQIGLTEAQAQQKYGDKITVVKEGFDHNDRAIAEGAKDGHIKLVLKGKKVIGASIVGKGAGELILPIAQMISGKTSSLSMISTVIPYPTRSEIIKAATSTAWEPTAFGALPKKVALLVARFRRLLS